jgi:hypothetical protein
MNAGTILGAKGDAAIAVFGHGRFLPLPFAAFAYQRALLMRQILLTRQNHASEIVGKCGRLEESPEPRNISTRPKTGVQS